MFNQLIYFIVALLLFSIQQPGAEVIRSPFQTFFLAIWIFVFFVLICYLAFRPLKHALQYRSFFTDLTLHYHRIQTQLSILALGFLAFDVYVLNIKLYLGFIPWFEQSLTLSGSVGLALYLIHLSVIRFWGYPVYRFIHQSQLSRTDFVKESLAFDFAILIPWFLISFIMDLFQIVPTPPFFDTAAGETVLLGVALVFFVFFAPALVVRLWRCEPMPASSLRAQLEDFCRKHRFRIGNFLLWPLLGGETLTAAVMGLLPRLRYILITQGLLRLLDVEELKAVVAHEMGHVRRYHVLFYMFFFICYSVLAYSVNDILLILLLRQKTVLNWALSGESTRLTFFSAAYTLPILLLIVIYFRYIFGFFMRNSERQADLYAFQLVGHPFTLVSSLQKIAMYSGQIEDLPSWHHFSIRQRIDFLMDCHKNPSLIRKHHQKLYGSALLFFMIVGTLIWTGQHLQNTKTFQSWQQEIQFHIVERELREKPGNAELYAAYGGMLLEKGRYKEAEEFLKKSLDTDPNQAITMNNLAWLYATSPPPYFKPEAALELAERAASREPEPHILDTLAEAYYVNGDYRKALETIQQALSKAVDKRDYYLEQEQKFQKALTRSK